MGVDVEDVDVDVVGKVHQRPDLSASAYPVPNKTATFWRMEAS
jgi:hypothetical protein